MKFENKSARGENNNATKEREREREEDARIRRARGGENSAAGLRLAIVARGRLMSGQRLSPGKLSARSFSN
jgi:hypothetical protein